ncbi:adenosine deaminase [Streptosporangium fragile]|uniref:adenosine deaminase n=1 Tax=Streptosporangium fragile TaxID=46186 RepID=A0ABN3W3V1_9ACTN
MLHLDARPGFDELLEAPKVLLHDHLDGGLRPSTIVDLAARDGYRDLPSMDPEELRRWFARARESSSLPVYLSGFHHAYGVLQTRQALVRAARENVQDLAADGVVYAETRFAPELHLQRGLTGAQVLDAVLAGTREGVEEAAGRIDVRVIVCAMRDRAYVRQAAELVHGAKNTRVVAFDLGGPEAGNSARKFRETFLGLRERGIHVTIHAGEGDGLASIQAALDCGAERLGHGVRIVEDLDSATARRVRDQRIILETSPSSNVHTGAAASFRQHPALRLSRAGFAVTVNTDNRLMSQTTLTQDFHELARHQDLTWSDVVRMTTVAAHGAFLPPDERRSLRDRVTGWYRDRGLM